MNITKTENAQRLGEKDKEEIVRSVRLAVGSYVERGILYNSHIPHSHLFNRIREESKTANEAISALFEAPQGVMGSIVRATILHRDLKILTLLKPHLDEPTQWIVEGIIEGMRKDGQKTEDANLQLRL